MSEFTNKFIEIIQIQCTCNTEEEAAVIADALVAERLVACVQILGPIRSIYQWQGKVERSQEYLCLMKTRQTLFEPVCRRIRALHSYQCPQLVATNITEISPDYRDWLCEETQEPL